MIATFMREQRHLTTRTHGHPKEWTRESAVAHLRRRHHRLFSRSTDKLEEMLQVHRILHEAMGERV